MIDGCGARRRTPAWYATVPGGSDDRPPPSQRLGNRACRRASGRADNYVMCNRFSLRSRLNRILQVLAVEVAEAAGLPPRYNVSPTQTVAAIRQGDGRRTLSHLRWGLVPSWAKDLKFGQQCLTARGE